MFLLREGGMTQLVESDLAELKILRKEYAHLKGQFPEIFKAGRLDLDKLADMLAAVKEAMGKYNARFHAILTDSQIINIHPWKQNMS